MAISRAKKEEVIAKLERVRDEAATIVFVRFNGLTVAESNAMRRELQEAGVEFYVAKKTLLQRVFGGAFMGEYPELEGEIAVAYSDDQLAPAQNLHTFAKRYKDRVTMVAGVFAGSFQNQAQIQEIASIPSMHELRGMFVNVVNAPIQGLATVLDRVAEQKNV
jgi:large subunit ribosomal protein L10